MSALQELWDDRTGFSLVELLMVAVVGSVIVVAGGQMFVSQSRLFIAQREILDSRESLRAATILLTGEIHEISAADGDLFSAQRDSLVMRSVQGAGVVCSHTWVGNARRLGIQQSTGQIGDRSSGVPSIEQRLGGTPDHSLLERVKLLGPSTVGRRHAGLLLG